ncbi:hypothetical protein DSAG12_01424 [Promethearchaeum syntrophicum]|uniref:Uncharacterized protein n=1 Tax=Promethearchaeum syntrophicum TaxID=2594042 RepID=A0A5B9D8L0_9ARCH|nr:hypothetical protein [Candidatus Prometheoarchaeum syntrophicum]QEE15598.1 hypothetical protein DSAG12_01424 [Candidatus Prometheoarchaeum syntrophicum]
METNLILLFITAAIKTAVLFLIASYLINKWAKQKLKYFTDFPFLNALGFYIFSFGKLLDMFLYYHFINTPNLAILNDSSALLLGRIRFILSPILVVLPYFILMLVIWLENRKKIQKVLGFGWIVLSIVAVLLAKGYTQFLFFNLIIAFPVILLSIISFAVIHHQQKLPQINSLFITIGWGAYLITQIIRPFWISLGNSSWGLTWVGEFVELISMTIIGIGFIRPASYFEKSINQFLIKKTFENDDSIEIDDRNEVNEKNNETEEHEEIIEVTPKWKYDVECYIP